MHLTSKTHNACLAVFELSMRYHLSQPVCLRTIADAHQMSSQFLVQILLQLKRAGLVDSVRGACGGYRLARCPADISLLDVVTAMEGARSGDFCFGGESAVGRVLQETWSEISECQRQRLREITFDDLVVRAQSQMADMYYI